MNENEILSLVQEADPPDPMTFVEDIVRPLALKKVSDTILHCQDCPCASNAIHSVPTGDPAKASVLVIGESVIEEQKESGKNVVAPFEGTKENELLNKLWTAYHVKMDALYFVNTVNCYPGDTIGKKLLKRIPSTEECENCSIYLNYIIRALQPLYIILMGNIALNNFKKSRIEDERGKWMDIQGIPTMPTYSPSYLLQIEKLKDKEIVETYKEDMSDDVYRVFERLVEDFPDDWKNVLSAPLD